MLNSRVFEDNHYLMVTYTDDTTKTLHKIDTEEYYDDPIDLIVGHYSEGRRAGQPKGLYEYEEVDRPEEPQPPETDENQEENPGEFPQEGEENSYQEV